MTTPTTQDELRDKVDAWFEEYGKKPSPAARGLAVSGIMQLITTHYTPKTEQQDIGKIMVLVQELREDADGEDDTWTVGRLDEIIGYALPIGHPDYWKWHCHTCGKWPGHEMEGRGEDYCECE